MDVSFRPARPEDAGELWRLNTAFNGPGDKAPAEMAADLAAPGGELTFVAQGGPGPGGVLLLPGEALLVLPGAGGGADGAVCGAGLPPDGGGKGASRSWRRRPVPGWGRKPSPC